MLNYIARIPENENNLIHIILSNLRFTVLKNDGPLNVFSRSTLGS